MTGALTANGAGLTNLNAGNITTGTLDNNRLGVVPTTKGGTGLSAAGAAANYLRSDGTNWASSALQAADLSGIVGIIRGGTGLSVTGAAGNYLRSNGTNWASSALQAADIPTGSANYIQNSNSLQASSNFNLSGNGTAGGTLSGNIVNATAQFNLNGSRILSNPGTDNLFAGIGVGASNTTGFQNAFFGQGAGQSNTEGIGNTIVGRLAGSFNTTGNSNAFFGRSAGSANTTGSHNTMIGNDADVGANNLSNATAIGDEAIVTASNRIQLGRDGTDTVSIGDLTAASATHVCINGTVLSSCSSSLRYKERVQPLRHGLKLIQQLRPVTFTWKERQEPDLGLIAEEVAKVEPLLVTHNKTGVIEGVKYDQLAVVLINAVKEQQQQIEQLRAAKAALEQRLAALEKLVQANRSTQRARARATR